MVSEWRRVRLGDYTDSALGKMLDAQKNKGTPHPYLGNSNVRWGAFDLSSLSSMKFEEDEDERYGIRDGDLIVCEGGEPGRCAIWRGQVPDMKIQKALHRIRSKEGLSNHYLFYWFMLAGRMGWLEPFFTGTTIKHLTGKALKELEVPLPSIDEQRAIAHILGALDDKIELNRKQNETLEAMARATFKAWFVDFEPVRAKMEGRWQRGQSLPGLPAHLYDHFPDRLVESELGKIPEGWEVPALGDFVEVVKGRSYKSEELAESTTALVTLKSFARGGGYRTDGLKSFTGKYKQEQTVVPGEVVIACTDVTQAAELIGRAAIVRSSRRYQTLVASLDTMIVRPRSERVTRAFLYCLGRSDSFIAHTYSHTTGTTVLHLGKEAIPTYAFALPPEEIVRHFDAATSHALERTDALEEESERLVALRDSLLPKLISGELRIADAEAFLKRRGV